MKTTQADEAGRSEADERTTDPKAQASTPAPSDHNKQPYQIVDVQYIPGFPVATQVTIWTFGVSG